MHIGKMKKLKIVIAVAALLIILIGAVTAYTVTGSAKGTDAAPQTAAVERRDLVKSVTLSGTIQSRESYSITSQLSDITVKSVNVKVGDRVKKGDVIAVLDDTQIKKSLERAEKALEGAQNKNNVDLKVAQRSYTYTADEAAVQNARNQKDEADAVAQYNQAVADKSSLNTKYDKAVKDQQKLEAELKDAKDSMADTKKELKEMEKAVEKAQKNVEEKKIALDGAGNAGQMQEEEVQPVQGTEQQEYEEALSELSSLQAEYEKAQKEAKAEQSEVAKSEKKLEEMETQKGSLSSELKSADETLQTAKSTMEKAGQEKEDAVKNGEKNIEDQKDALTSAKLSASDSLVTAQDEVDKLKAELEKCTVCADADGIVTAVSVKEGDSYKGDEIAVVQDDSGYKVVANADQYDIGNLQNGQTGVITTSATGEDELKCEVSFVAPTPSVTEKGTQGTDYQIEASLTDADSRIRIGMTAKLVITVKEEKQVLAVPSNCVQTDENGNNYVTHLSDTGEMQKIPVTYGLQTDYYAEIKGEGLKEGMLLVIPENGADGMSADDGTGFYE